MNIERLMKKEQMTPREMLRYMEISFQVSMGLRPAAKGTDAVEHLNKQMQGRDPLIMGYVMALTLLRGDSQPTVIL